MMKNEIEKKQDSFKSRVPAVTIDPELNKYKGKILFPNQLKRAEEHLKGIKLPDIIIESEMEKEKGKIHFPEKLARADEMPKTAKFPPSLDARRKP